MTYQLKRTNPHQMKYSEIVAELDGIFQLDEISRRKGGVAPGAIFDRVWNLQHELAIRDYGRLCEGFDELRSAGTLADENGFFALDVALIPHVGNAWLAGWFDSQLLRDVAYAMDVVVGRHGYRVAGESLCVDDGRIWFRLERRQ